MVINIVSTKFTIVITCLSLYCVVLNHLLAGSIILKGFRSKLDFFPLLHICRGLLYLLTIYSMVFTRLEWLVVYHIFCWQFCTLASVTTADFLPDEFSNSRPLQMLKIIAYVLSSTR